MTTENMTFEEALKELDQVLDHLNSGDIPLEEALSQYQHGMEMAAHCRTKLDRIENALKVLKNGEESPFLIEEE